MKTIRKIFIISLMLAGPLIRAQWISPDAFWTAGVKVGTPGLGAEVSYHFRDDLALRVGYQTFTLKYSDDEFDEDVELKLETIPIVVDWYPGQGRFRFSAGLFHNGS